MKKSGFFVFAVVFISFLLPMAYLFIYSIKDGRVLSFAAYFEVIGSKRVWLAIFYTFGIAAAVSLLALLIGGALAFLMAYSNIGKQPFIVFFIYNFFLIPSYVIAFAWNEVVGVLFSFRLYSAAGMIFIFTLCGIPIAYSFLYYAMKELPAEPIRASQNAGYSLLQSIWNIDFAALRFSFLAAFLLVLLYCVDNFSIAAFLGIPARIPMLSTLIYEKVTSLGQSNFSQAAALSCVTGGLVFLILLIERRFIKKQSFGQVRDNKAEPLICFSPKKRQVIEWSVLSILFLLQAIPFVFLLSRSFTERYCDIFQWDKLSFKHYAALLTERETYQTIFFSMRISFAAAFLCIVLAFFCIGGQILYQKIYWHWLERVAAVFYALPGIIVALAVLYFWGGIQMGEVQLYGTSLLLVFAYMNRFFLGGLRGVRNAYYALEKEAFEAALMLDANHLRRFFKIIFPPMKQQILYTFFLLFIPMMNEVTLSAILSTAHTKTIGLSIFNLQQGGEDFKAYAFSICVIFLNLFFIGLGIYLSRGRDYGINRTESVKRIK